MKTAEIVKTAKGFYVTLRYGGQNRGREFFAIKTSVDAAEKTRKEICKRMDGRVIALPFFIGCITSKIYS